MKYLPNEWSLLLHVDLSSQRKKGKEKIGRLTEKKNGELKSCTTLRFGEACVFTSDSYKIERFAQKKFKTDFFHLKNNLRVSLKSVFGLSGEWSDRKARQSLQKLHLADPSISKFAAKTNRNKNVLLIINAFP